MNKLQTSESGFGEMDFEGSAVEEFFNKFVPKLDSLAQEDDELLEDPTIDLDAMAVCQPPPQKKILRQQKQPQQHHQQHHQQQQQQRKQQQQQPHRPKMIMANDGNTSNGSDSGRDLSMDEIGLIVGQLRGGGPYSEKLVTIMLKGLEKTLTSSFYRLFLESGLPENWCPIVKMNNDNTPFVEFLIKSDLSDQDPFSQLSEYSTEHMALCRFVVNQLHLNATRQQPKLTAQTSKRSLGPPSKRSSDPISLLAKPKSQQQPQQQQQMARQPQTQQHSPPRKQPPPRQQQQQRTPQKAPQKQQQQQSLKTPQYQQQPQKQPNLQQQTFTFGIPLACSTPKQRILPPRTCKSANPPNYRKH